MIKFLKQVYSHFSDNNTFQSAALAYYSVFSLLPIIIVLTSLLGLLFGKQAVSGEIYAQLKDVLGNNASMQIQTIIKSQHTNHNNIFTSIIGFVTLALSASGMFIQIHNAFNSIWDIKSKPKSSIFNYIFKHLTSFSILIGLFFIIIISTAINSFLVKHSSNIPHDYQMLYIADHIISFVVFSIVFSVMYSFLGDAKVYWKSAIYGGLFTSLLFIFGKVAIGMYIGHSHTASAFGSASVLALLMLWVYYTSQIIFLGASFVKVISDYMGYEILPNSNAVKVAHVEVK